MARAGAGKYLLKIAAAVHLRQAIEGELILVLNRVVSVLAGLLLDGSARGGHPGRHLVDRRIRPFRGIMLIALAVRLRSHQLRQRQPGPVA